MLVDSFDSKRYTPHIPVESRSGGEKVSFRSLLDSNSESSGSASALISGSDQYSGAVDESRRDKFSGAEKNQSDANIDSDIKDHKVHIGTITESTPTVSELLYTTKYKKNCWEMLDNNVNSEKRFRKIPTGTDIYVDRNTSEIIWKRAGSNDGLNSSKSELEAGNRVIRSTESSINSPASLNSSQSLKSALSGEKRRGYSYRRGTTETSEYNPADSLLTPGKYDQSSYQPGSSAYRSISSRSSSQADPKKYALNEAVREFMGKDYSKMDCYELVVGGLQNMGVQYQGQGGLGRYLIDKAVGEGLNRNYYLNGEGLVEATGYSVYNKTVNRVKNPTSQAYSAMLEMENVLKEGQILSFSTRTRGHTGVISKKDGVWTFINSGYMDNNLSGSNGEKKVGEEVLAKELENWFKLSGSRGEGLKITLGNIDTSKIAAYRNDKSRLSKKV